jgi:hypothetical protein
MSVASGERAGYKHVARSHQVPKRKAQKPSVPNDPPETQAADAITVLWLLLALTALVCEVSWGAARWYLTHHPEGQGAVAIHFLLALTALATGGLVLLLVPVVLKVRQQAPPPSITMATIAIGAAPYMALLVLLAQ